MIYSPSGLCPVIHLAFPCFGHAVTRLLVGGQRQRLSGLGVPAGARGHIPHGECAKSGQLDLPPPGQQGLKRFDGRIHRLMCNLLVTKLPRYNGSQGRDRRFCRNYFVCHVENSFPLRFDELRIHFALPCFGHAERDPLAGGDVNPFSRLRISAVMRPHFPEREHTEARKMDAALGRQHLLHGRHGGINALPGERLVPQLFSDDGRHVFGRRRSGNDFVSHIETPFF